MEEVSTSEAWCPRLDDLLVGVHGERGRGMGYNRCLSNSRSWPIADRSTCILAWSHPGALIAYLRAMNSMQSIERLLEDRAQLVVQCRLTCENRITARLGCPNHAEHSIGRRVGLKGMVAVVFATEIAELADVARNCQRRETRPSKSNIK